MADILIRGVECTTAMNRSARVRVWALVNQVSAGSCGLLTLGTSGQGWAVSGEVNTTSPH